MPIIALSSLQGIGIAQEQSSSEPIERRATVGGGTSENDGTSEPRAISRDE